ncbi:MAG: hypothetical protein WDW36_000274 [Sanguina aurantia]
MAPLSAEGPEPQRLDGWALEVQQLRFQLWRHSLHKRRSWVQTSIEVLSPVFIMLALVAAYQLSELEVWPEHIYADDTQVLLVNASATLVTAVKSEGVIECMVGALGKVDLPAVDSAVYAKAVLEFQARAGPGDPSQGFAWPGRHLMQGTFYTNANLKSNQNTTSPDLISLLTSLLRAYGIDPATLPDLLAGLLAGSGLGSGSGPPNLLELIALLEPLLQSLEPLLQSAGYSLPGAGFSFGGGNSSGQPLDPDSQAIVDALSQTFVAAVTLAASNPQFQADFSDCAYRAALVIPQAVASVFNLYLNINGPLPAITFDEFVMLTKAIELVLPRDSDIQKALDLFKRDFGMNWLGNLVGLGKLAFVPATPEVYAFVDYMSKSHVFFDDVFLGVFNHVSDLEAMAQEGYRFWAVVQFDKGPSRANDAGTDYTIRMALPETPETFVAVEKFDHWISKRYKMYFTSGFFSLEAAINNYVLGNSPELEASLVFPRQSGHGLNNDSYATQDNGTYSTQAYNIWFGAFPKGEFTFNKFYQAVGPMLGLLLCLSILFPLAMFIRGIVEEKEMKLREVLYIMGLRSWVLYASWLITYLVIFTMLSFLIVIVTGSSFLAASSKSLLMAYFVLFSIAELCFGVMISTLFNSAKVAAIVGPLAHFAFTMPRYIFTRTGSPQYISAKIATSLLAPSAFTFGADLIAKYEDSGSGLQWIHLWADPYPFGGTMLMLVLDAFIYLALAWYLDKVVSSGYGSSLPFYFPLDPRHWKRVAANRSRDAVNRRRRQLHSHATTTATAASNDNTSIALVSSPMHHSAFVDSSDGGLAQQQQQDPSETNSLLAQQQQQQQRLGGMSHQEMTHGVMIHQGSSAGGWAGAGASAEGEGAVEMSGLHMRYPNGVVAVHSLSLSMATGQITGLLGHNGAGKSTTVAMLTGLVMPTSGDVTIAGCSIVHDTVAARASLGICPQQNVMLDYMSVLEHLMLLASVKGVPGAQCMALALEMSVIIGLPNDRATLSKNLSGGMKRKLQVGMALIGGSKVVLLDEPTSGMDPTARRSLWSLLRSVKAGRALLLTTHYMDEADILCDKVAILAGGRLCCCGSPLALKESYGNGYTLTVTKAATAGYVTSEVEAAVRAHVPTAQLVRAAAAEIIIRLPLDAAHRFPSMFDHLEINSEALGIAQLGVAMPTMEEVFLRATDEAADKPYDLHATSTMTQQDLASATDAASHTAPPSAPTAPHPAPAVQAAVRHADGSGGGRAVSAAAVAPPPRQDEPAVMSVMDGHAAPGGTEMADLLHSDAGVGSRYQQLQGRESRSSRASSAAVDPFLASPLGQHSGGSGGGTASGGHPLLYARDNVQQQQQPQPPLPPQPPALMPQPPQPPQPTQQQQHDATPFASTSRPGPVAEGVGRQRGLDRGPASDPNPNPKYESFGVAGSGASGGGGGGHRSPEWDSAAHAAPAAGPHMWRCFKQMFVKRRCISLRDWKALLFLFLLPVAAVALTLTILTINVDPTGPSLILSMHSIEQFSPIPLSNNPAPSIISGCIQPTGFAAKEVAQTIYNGWVPKYQGVELCPNGLYFLDVNSSTDSYSMSEWLLGQFYEGTAPQYGAVVFDDPSVLSLSPFIGQLSINASLDLQAVLNATFQTVDIANLTQYVFALGALPGGIPAVFNQLVQSIDPTQLLMIVQNFINSLSSSSSGSASVSGSGRHLLQGNSSATPPTPTPTPTPPPNPLAPNTPPPNPSPAAASSPPSLPSPSAGSPGNPPTATPPGAPSPPPSSPTGSPSSPTGSPSPPPSSPTSSSPGGSGAMSSETLGLLLGLAPQLLPLLGTPQAQAVGRGLLLRFQSPPVTLLFNGSSFHSTMALFTDLQQALANVNASVLVGLNDTQVQAMARSEWRSNRLLRVTNHPLPLTKRDSAALDSFLTILAAVAVLVPFCYLSGAYAVSPVSETTSGSKAMQLGSGCPRFAYWGGSYAWDLATHLVVTLLSIATFAAFDDQAVIGSWDRCLGTFLLIFGYGAGVIPLSYCYSFGYTSPSTAQVSVSAVNFVLGFMFVVGSQTMANIPQSKAFQRVAVHFCRLLPPFNLGEGLINLSTYNLLQTLAGDVASVTTDSNGSPKKTPVYDELIPSKTIAASIRIPHSAFAWKVVGRSLAALYGEAIFFFLLAVAIDKLRTDARWSESLSALLRNARLTLTAHALSIAPYPRRPPPPLPHPPPGRHRPSAPAAGRRRREEDRDPVSEDEGHTRLLSLARASSSGMLPSTDQQMVSMGGGGGTGSGSSAGGFGGGGPTRTQLLSRSSARWEVWEGVGRGGGGGGAGASSRGSSHLLDGAVGGVAGENPDVAGERARLDREGVADSEAIAIRHLCKVYPTSPPKVAVHDLSLGVPQGQRFGFLGANGAGKSTTLSIISGQQTASSGDALVTGYSVSWQHDAAQHRIGYCPQIDPLLEHMSAREQLHMFARIKGVPEAGVVPGVASLLQRVGLPASMADRASGTLSGGNKRKVALAIALSGRPAAVLLDEPSSGMDPGARRLMWEAILRATQPGPATGPLGIAMLLTTHYMEECEALCERVGIMNKGRLVCLGSPQHLKSTFGGAYRLEIHGPEGREATAAICRVVGEAFPGAGLEEDHFGHLKFALPAEGLSLARVFKVLESSKASLGVSAYAVSQPTLEQVFLAVVGHGLSGEGDAGGDAP